MAEVDGNRTRRTGSARPSRFEGGGAHQVPGHLRAATLQTTTPRSVRVGAMKKLLVLLVVVGLVALAAKKVRTV